MLKLAFCRENLHEAAGVPGGQLHAAHQRLHTNHAVDVIDAAFVTSLQRQRLQQWLQLRSVVIVVVVEIRCDVIELHVKLLVQTEPNATGVVHWSVQFSLFLLSVKLVSV